MTSRNNLVNYGKQRGHDHERDQMKLHMEKTRITGQPGWHCRIGARDFYGATKKEVEADVWDWMQEASRPPEVALVRNRGKIRVLLSHAGQTETYRPFVGSPVNGLVMLVNTCVSNWDITEQAKTEFLNL